MALILNRLLLRAMMLLPLLFALQILSQTDGVLALDGDVVSGEPVPDGRLPASCHAMPCYV